MLHRGRTSCCTAWCIRGADDFIQWSPTAFAEVPPPAGMLSSMVRRNRSVDPLLPLPQPTWLVVRDQHSLALEWRRLHPGADRRAILGYERDQRVAAGWTCDDIGRACTFFFAERGGVRLFVGVERYDPAGPGPPGTVSPKCRSDVPHQEVRQTLNQEARRQRGARVPT